MTNIITIVQDILLPLLGAGGVIWTILYHKQNKRVKTAEATNSEIEALKNAIDTMRKQVEHLNNQIDILEKRVAKKDELVDVLRSNLTLKEWKYNLKKQAIAQAYGCDKCKDCPVLLRQTELDSEYLEKIEKVKKKDSITIHGDNTGVVGNNGTIGNIGCNHINTEKDATNN